MVLSQSKNSMTKVTKAHTGLTLNLETGQGLRKNTLTINLHDKIWDKMKKRRLRIRTILKTNRTKAKKKTNIITNLDEHSIISSIYELYLRKLQTEIYLKDIQTRKSILISTKIRSKSLKLLQLFKLPNHININSP